MKRKDKTKESIINVCDLVNCNFIFQIILGGFKYMFTDVSMVAVAIVTIYGNQNSTVPCLVIKLNP